MAALLVVQTVMNGFGEEHRIRIRESFGDCVVLSRTTIPNPTELVKKLRTDDEVLTASAFTEGPALSRHGQFSGVAFVRGVDLSVKEQPARPYIAAGSFDDLDDGRVILGYGLARNLHISVGDKIELWSPAMAELAEKGQAPLPAELEVCGIVRTGFTEVDDRAAIIPIRRFRELWAMGTQAHGITLRFKNPNEAPAIAARLNVGQPDFHFVPWQEIKKNFLEAIRFEKTMLFFLMFIITLVASFSIGSTLFSAVIRRTREVGVLVSLGARRWQIVALFGIQGLVIGFLGTFLGFILTWSILASRENILNFINRIFGDGDMIANVYQFSKVPLYYDTSDFLLAAGFTLIVTTLAGLVPAIWAASRKPSEAMRHV